MRQGSLFSGYGGLDQAVASVFGATTAWVCDNDPGASKLLAHRVPNVPNLGDVTAVDWSSVEPVELLAAGYPCQPFSDAGRRRAETDERYLWPEVARAVRAMGPRYVVLENVRGHLVRGFARVLGELADLGYDCRWVTVRASEVGAPHRRERLFVLATNTRSPARRPEARGAVASARTGPDRQWATQPRGLDRISPDADVLGRDRGSGAFGQGGNAEPTHGGESAPDTLRAGLEDRDSLGGDPREECAAAKRGCGPAPDTDDGRRPGRPTGLLGDVAKQEAPRGRDVAPDAESVGHGDAGATLERGIPPAALGGRPPVEWGQYRHVIERWERVLGRVAPEPTEPNTRGGRRLSPRFVEWLMGLEEGWVTDVPGLTRNDKLRLLGNGVVPQQGAAAVSMLYREQLLDERIDQEATA